MEVEFSSEAEKLAFFINLHNLLTIHALLLTAESNQKAYKAANKTIYNIGGFNLSLLEIEHAILRAKSPPPSSKTKFFFLF